MKRVVMVVGLLVAAGAGAYGQGLFKAETPSLDAIQAGILYEASFCGGTGSFGVRMDMRVTKLLNDRWFEAEYGYVNRETGEFPPSKEVARFNRDLLCYVKPIKPFVR